MQYIRHMTNTLKLFYVYCTNVMENDGNFYKSYSISEIDYGNSVAKFLTHAEALNYVNRVRV